VESRQIDRVDARDKQGGDFPCNARLISFEYQKVNVFT
jgi:hypothetical protein